MPRVDEPAPDFEALDEEGRRVRLADFRGKRPVVLMFYPADNTPGCTRQLCTARDDYSDYESAGIAVFGVNPNNASSHKRFSEKHEFRTPLLVDERGAMARAYDALLPIPILTIVNRTVVGIDKEGVIRYYKRGMPPTQEILAAMTAASPA